MFKLHFVVDFCEEEVAFAVYDDVILLIQCCLSRNPILHYMQYNIL